MKKNLFLAFSLAFVTVFSSCGKKDEDPAEPVKEPPKEVVKETPKVAEYANPGEVLEEVLTKYGDVKKLNNPAIRRVVNKPMSNGHLPLYYLLNNRAAAERVIPYVDTLVKAGGDINARDGKHNTYIIDMLVASGQKELLKYLLEQGYFHKGMLQIGLSSSWDSAGAGSNVTECRRLLMEYGAVINVKHKFIPPELQNVQVKSGVKYAAEPEPVNPPEDLEEARKNNARLITMSYSGEQSQLSQICGLMDTEAVAYLCRRGFSLLAVSNPEICDSWPSPESVKNDSAVLDNSIAFVTLLLEKGHRFSNGFVTMAIVKSCTKDNFDRLFPIIKQVSAQAVRDRRMYIDFKKNPSDLTPEQLKMLYELLDNPGVRRVHSPSRTHSGQRPVPHNMRPESRKTSPAEAASAVEQEAEKKIEEKVEKKKAETPEEKFLESLVSGASADETIESLRNMEDIAKFVNAKDANGNHALVLAKNQPRVVRFLIQNGAVADEETVKILLSQPCQPISMRMIFENSSQEEKDRLLAECVSNFNRSLSPNVRGLVMAGANPEANMPSGEKIIEYAVSKNGPGIQQLFMVRGRSGIGPGRPGGPRHPGGPRRSGGPRRPAGGQ